MRDIFLAEHRGAVGVAARPQAVELARFKDDTATAPRVVAGSRDWVVYSLKNRASLRVLNRKPPANQLSFKQHTEPVTAVQFVNSRSNIAASTSQKELIVWYVDDDGEIYTYFTFRENVVSFAWVPTVGQPPDLLVLIDNGQTKETGILKASTLILQSAPEAGGAIRKPDGTLVADRSHFTPLRTGIVCDRATAQTSAASPILAFSTSNTSIVTTSLGNRDAPSWQPCQGEAVLQFTVLPNAILVAVSPQSVFVWDVSGEPVPLQHFFLGGRRCTALHNTSTRAVLYLSTGNPAGCEAMVLKIEPSLGASATAFYDVPASVSQVSSCVVAGPNDEPRLHVDSSNVLQVVMLEEAPWNGLGSAPVGKPTVAAKAAVSPVPAAAPAPFSPPAAPAARPGNRGRLADGLPSSAEIEALKSHIEAAIANTASMMNVAKSVVTKDHEAHVQEALKAQARSLSVALASRQPGAAPSSLAFDAVIEGITEPVATALVDGISAAVEEQLRQQLEAALRTVLTRQEKKKQRDLLQDVAKNLDTVVADIMVQVQATVQQKQSAYASRLIHYVSDVASEGWNAAQQLQNVIAAQQQQLTAITQSGLLEEVQRLRAEVAELKRRNSTSARNETAELPRETVLSNAAAQLAAGNHAVGLNWILHYDDAAAIQQLLSGCPQETRDAMLSDPAVTDQMWGRIAAMLASLPKKETLGLSVSWLCDILAEKESLTKNDQLIVTINAYLTTWKSVTTMSNEDKSKLRELFMLVRR